MYRELNNMIKPIIENKDINLAELLITYNIFNLDLLSMYVIYGKSKEVNFVLYTLKNQQNDYPNIFNDFINVYLNNVQLELKELSKNKQILLIKKTNLNLKYISKYLNDTTILTKTMQY